MTGAGLEEEPTEEHADLLDFLYVCPVALAQLDADGQTLMANPAYSQLMVQIDPMQGMGNFLALIGRYAPEVLELVTGLQSRAGLVCKEHRVTFGPVPSAPFPLVGSLTMHRLTSGRIVVVMADVSSLVAQEKVSREADQRFRSIVDGVRDYAIFSLDVEGRVSTWNRSAEKLFGLPLDQALGRELAALLPPEDRNGARAQAIQASARAVGWGEDEGWWMREATTRFWGNAIVSAVEGGGFTVILRDLSRRKRNEDELRAQANADALTGLSNRRYLIECGNRELFRARQAEVPVSVLMLDADHFKKINDEHGHPAGDQVLRSIAKICRDQTRDVDVVARYGGEEIVVVLPDTDLVGARNVAERIRLSVEAYREAWATGLLRATVSIGVASSADDDAQLDQLIARADAALYEAKGRGRNRTVLAPPSAPQLAKVG